MTRRIRIEITLSPVDEANESVVCQIVKEHAQGIVKMLMHTRLIDRDKGADVFVTETIELR